MTSRSIAIANHHPHLRLDRRALARAIAVLDAHAELFAPRRLPRGRPPIDGVPPGELSLVFLTDAALAQLHAEFLDDPSITDVITFEGDPALGIAGEICVSVDAAMRHFEPRTAPASAAKKRPATARPRTGTAAQAFSEELTLYVVHGWLHLAGYDDLEPAKKRVMRRAEARALRLLRLAPAGLPRFLLT